MKKIAIILIAIAMLPYVLRLNHTYDEAKYNASWVTSAWASRDSMLGDTTVFKASKKILARANVVIGTPSVPTSTFPGGRVDSIYAKYLSVTTFSTDAGATPTAALDSTVIKNPGIGADDYQVNSIDSTKVRTLGSANLPSTITGNKVWTGRATLNSGLDASDSVIVTVGVFRIGSGTTPNVWQIGKNLYIGTVTLNPFMTGPGITIDQGGSNDEILSLQSTGVAHGITSVTQTKSFAQLLKDNSAGGLIIRGLRQEGYTGMHLLAAATYDTNATSTGAVGYFNFQAQKKLGTSTTQPGATANLMVIRAEGTTEFIFDGSGNGKAHGTWSSSAFDEAEEYDVLLPDTTNAPAYMRAQYQNLIYKSSTKDASGNPVYPLPDTTRFTTFSLMGCVVTIDSTANNRFTLTNKPYQVITGVVSYHPAQLADPYKTIREKYPQLQLAEYKNPTSVGILGLIPTKVCNEGGAINRGDFLVSSSKQGVAMKGSAISISIMPRSLIGIAMMPFNATNADSVGTINVQR